MHINFLGLAIPLFLGFILLEYFISAKKGLKYFNLHNAIANISVGIAERLADVFAAGFFYLVYDTVQQKFGFFQIPSNIAVWVLLFIATDFIWYWYHRLGHEVNIFWMAHIVHHQSEDFNLTVSARITVFQAVLRHAFWLILPLIGFRADMIISILLVHGFYPFFVHTRLIGKLGILEYLLVTPSHHRVHHASNPQYLDKNYGDVLIIWDKLFGTFQKEKEEPVFGLTKPLKTYSFLWQHFHFCIELWLAVKNAPGFWAKCKLLLGPPEKVGESLRGEAENIFSIYKNETPIGRPLNRYVVWQVIVVLVSLTAFIACQDFFNLQVKIAFSLFTILTLINCGAIMEKKKWVFYMEYIRLVVVFYLPFAAPGFWVVKLLLVVIVSMMIARYSNKIQRRYYRYVLS